MIDVNRSTMKTCLSVLLCSASFLGINSAAKAQDDISVLLAPADAVPFEASTNPAVTGPISEKPISLPYAQVLPLPEGPIGDPARTYTFCFSQALTGSTWAVAQQESVMIEAARHPNVKILSYNTNNDPLKQVADLDTCAAQQVDGILVWPHSVAPLSPQIAKLHKDGFVVVGMERTVNTQDYSSWVYLDNAKATADLADAVCKQLGGSGIVVETDGAIGSSPQILRRAGFVDALAANCPGVTVEFTQPTDYSRGQGYKVALDYLQANQDKEIGAWYTQYTEIGFGVAQALADYNRTDIPQYSIVDGKAAVEAVQAGTFVAVAPWTPVHGDLALRVAIHHVLGMEVPKNILLGQPPLITPENADQALEHTWPG
jgi:ABC-type sugar transport system substrate-binding protein